MTLGDGAHGRIDPPTQVEWLRLAASSPTWPHGSACTPDATGANVGDALATTSGARCVSQFAMKRSPRSLPPSGGPRLPSGYQDRSGGRVATRTTNPPPGREPTSLNQTMPSSFTGGR